MHMRFFPILVVLSLAVVANAAERSSSDYVVIPYDHYDEIGGLPPSLKVTFHLKCYQKFEQLIRYEDVDSAGNTTIVVGALVAESLGLSCKSIQKLTVDAGNTFSGREYSVVSIGATKPKRGSGR